MEMSIQLHADATLLPGEDPPSTHWVGVWVDPTAGLGDLERRKISCPSRESNHFSSVVQSVA